MSSVSPAASSAGHGFGASASLEALADTLASETRLLSNLSDLLRQQRAAVAADALEEIEDTVHNTHRVLMTLGEARRRRTALVDLLGAGTSGGPLQAEFDLLRNAALALSEEVEISRQILRRAMEGSEELIRAVYGAPETGSFYDQSAAPAPSGEGVEGTILRRRA
jgi:ABC-type transporter Mla subunit MlaD